MVTFSFAGRMSNVALWLAVLYLAASAQAAMLTSSVSVYIGAGTLTSGTSSCANSSVPAACSVAGTAFYFLHSQIRPFAGSASATPSLYDIDLESSVTGSKNCCFSVRSDARAQTEFVITGPNGSGFVQYQVSGDASTGSDNLGSTFRLRHGLFPEEFRVVFPYVFQPQSVSFTSQLYPVQFGEPFSFEWAGNLGISGTQSDVAPSSYMRLQLEILVLDSEERSLANAIVTETPEPAGFGLLLSGLGVMGFVFRLRRPRS